MTSSITDRLSGLSGNAATKVPVTCATTAEITLSGLQTIDGVTVSSQDRVLVKNQTDTTENGVYTASSEAWSRASDFDGARDVVTGTQVFVVGGTTNGATFWYVSTSGDPSPGDEISFTQSPVSASATLAANVSYDNVGSGMNASNVQDAIDELEEKYLNIKGSDIASATTTNIGAAGKDFIHITGTTQIESLGTSTKYSHVWVKFTGSLTLKHNATSLILPNNGDDIVTQAGDRAEFRRITTGNWICLNYERADGSPLNATTFSITDLTAVTSMQGTDQIPIASASASNANRKITHANFKTSIGVSDFVLLYEDEASSEASIVIDNTIITSDYDHYVIELLAIVPANSNPSLLMTVSADNGSSYESSGYSWESREGQSGFNSDTSDSSYTLINQVTKVASGGANLLVHLFNPASATYRSSFRAIGMDNNSLVDTCGYNSTALVIDNVKIAFDSGNITYAKVRVYAERIS